MGGAGWHVLVYTDLGCSGALRCFKVEEIMTKVKGFCPEIICFQHWEGKLAGHGEGRGVRVLRWNPAVLSCLVQVLAAKRAV